MFLNSSKYWAALVDLRLQKEEWSGCEYWRANDCMKIWGDFRQCEAKLRMFRKVLQDKNEMRWREQGTTTLHIRVLTAVGICGCLDANMHFTAYTLSWVCCGKLSHFCGMKTSLKSVIHAPEVHCCLLSDILGEKKGFKAFMVS